jgi:hypothetical protein
MIEVRIDTSELRDLFALIGRNIAGTPSEPMPRAPASAPANASRPEAAATDPVPLAEAESGAERSLVSASPVFTLIGLRQPLARLLVADASSPARWEREGGTGLGQEMRPERERAAARVVDSPAEVAAQASAAPRPLASAGSSPATLRSARAEQVFPDFAPSRRAELPGKGSGAPGRETFDPSAPSARSVDAAKTASPFADRSSRPAVKTGGDGSWEEAASSGRAEPTDGPLPTGERATIGEARRSAVEAAVPDDANAARQLGRSEDRSAIPGATGLSREVEMLLRNSGWGDVPAGAGQPERAGVIASFVLNAAMIPGWPPPRPIEPAAFARQIVVTSAGPPLETDEMEAGLLLLKTLRDPAVVAALLAALATQRRRRRILAILALLTANVKAVLSLWAAELAALPQAEPQGQMRERLALR